jgi:serine/threonine-protein kinase
MEYIDGGTLADRLNGRPQRFADAAMTVEKLARAVQHAHEQGIVHGDLKPANVLLTRAGTPKVADFALTQWFGQEVGRTRLGVILGTPGYLAPEQAGGHSHQMDPAVDTWALGAILYEMLTGRPPFTGADVMEILQFTVDAELVAPSWLRANCPRDLETICLKCLRKEPSRRYASAKELAEDLRRFLDDKPIRARPVGLIERLWRWYRKRPGCRRSW